MLKILFWYSDFPPFDLFICRCAMQAPYPFTETANLAKNAVVLGKKFDSVKQRGEKIEEMPQGTLEQPAEDDQQQQNRRLSAVREKIDCYGEIAGDKFSVEAKLATIVNSNEYPLKLEMSNANIEEHKEKKEAQVICSDQVTARKEELQSWVNTMVTKLGDSLQHSDGAEGMEACVGKYKDEAPYFQEVLSDTNQKIGDLKDTNLEREIPVLLAAQQDDEDAQYDMDWRKILPVNEKILEKLKQQVDRQRKKNQKIGVGDYVLVRYKNKIKGKRILEKQFAGQVIDTMNNDYIVSFLKIQMRRI